MPRIPETDREVRARLYDWDLNPEGPDFRVNTLLEGDATSPRLGDYGPAGFLVTWADDPSIGSDLDQGVQARLVTGTDQFAGAQMELNTFTAGAQEVPASHAWYGRLASVWRSAGNPDEPVDDVITGRDIEHCVFCDDLEWGSTWRWSQSAP